MTDLFSEEHLALGGRPEGGSSLGGVGDRGQDAWIGVAEDRGTPGLHVVEIRPAIDVGDVGTPRSSDEEGVPADGAERADRRVHTTWSYEKCARKQRLTSRSAHLRPDAMSSATSAAKYVRIRSAPARFIEVSVSKIACSRSMTPASAAPTIIAYSPET